MIARLADPRVAWTGVLVSAVCGAAFRHQPYFSQPFAAVAYLIALAISIRIAADYRGRSSMRLAWQLMAASAAMAVVRHGFELAARLLGWTETAPTTLLSLRQIPIVLSLLLLVAGLVAIWISFARLGRGFAWRAPDLLLIVPVVILVPSVFGLRENLGDARSAYAFIRNLQAASPVLLGAPALLGVLLYRVSVAMRGGRLARSLRILVWFLMARLAVLLVGLAPGLAAIPALAVVRDAVAWAVPWLFTLAVATRWELSARLARVDVRRETGFAELTRNVAEALGEHSR